MAVVLVPLIVCAEVIAFVLYGHQYSFSLQLSFFFALAATVYIVFLSYTWLAASVGARGAKTRECLVAEHCDAKVPSVTIMYFEDAL